MCVDGEVSAVNATTMANAKSHCEYSCNNCRLVGAVQRRSQPDVICAITTLRRASRPLSLVCISPYRVWCMSVSRVDSTALYCTALHCAVPSLLQFDRSTTDWNHSTATDRRTTRQTASTTCSCVMVDVIQTTIERSLITFTRRSNPTASLRIVFP